MKICLDANVLYPTFLRGMVLGAADLGLFEPIWSERILGEWKHTAERLNPGDGAMALGAQAVLATKWPEAAVTWDASLEEQLWLPDLADIHVLAAAIAGGADKIVTMNLKDFPKRELMGQGVEAVHPDAFLYALWLDEPEKIAEIAAQEYATFKDATGRDDPMRSLFKRARLPRLGKALAA